MAKKRFGPEQVVAKLRQIEVLTAAQAAEILQGRAPKGAVNAEHWTRKALIKK